MSNSVPFPSEKLGKRIKDLEDELAFRTRVLAEAKAAYDRAKQDLAREVDAIGAPADGRWLVFRYEASDIGPAGIYFEDFETKWDPEKKVFLPRTREEGLAWAQKMATKGHPIQVPEPPATTPSE